MIAVAGVLAPLGVSAARAGTVSETFNYTGSEQSLTVPRGVFNMQVLAVGGSGGTAARSGGVGAEVDGEPTVTPGETL